MYEDTKIEPLYDKQNNRPGLQGYLVKGTVLSGRYKIDRILGHGGFGITYKAWDTVLENYVAIKEYYPANIANRGADGKSISVMTQNDQKEFEEGVERFLREARDVSKFNSYSNIVSIHDFFEENSTAYMVMEYLEGQTLKEYMDSKSVIDESLQLHIAFSVLEVLETIHKKGLVHRDISPDNIFICNNLNIKLIDFGAAKNDTQNDVKTVSVVLKKGYAPIEQYSSKSIVSPKIDIYAFGATMYFMMTGIVPVPSVDRVIKDNLKEPKELNPSISEEWNKVILKCMQIKTEDRYSSVNEIRQDLLGKEISDNNYEVEYLSDVQAKKIDIKNNDNSLIKKNENDKKQIYKTKRMFMLASLGLCALIMIFSLGIHLTNKDNKSDITNNTIAEQTTEFIDESSEELLSENEIVYIYSFNDDFGDYLKFFFEKYPEYEDKIKYIVVGNGWGDDYINDINYAFEGDEKPSIVIYDVDYIDLLFNNDKYLSMDELDITEEMCSEMYPFTLDVATNNGKVMGLSWQACPGCFCYRIDIAEQVFGTSDPSVIGQYFSSWEGVLQAGELLKQAGFYLVPETTGVIRCMGKNYNSDVINTIIKNGYSKELKEWSKEWQEGFNTDIFGYFGCTWFGSLFDKDEMISPMGICTVPEAYYWGGSYLGVTTDCKNKELTKLIIYTMCCDAEVMYQMGIYSGWDLPNNLLSVQRMIDNGDELWDHNIIGTNGVLEVYYDIGLKSEGRKDKQITCYLRNIAINEKIDDYDTNVQSLSKSNIRYYHFMISGLIDNNGVNLKYLITYPDGTQEEGFFDNKFYNNNVGCVSVKSNIVGLETIDIYANYDDSNAYHIGTMSIQITD